MKKYNLGFIEANLTLMDDTKLTRIGIGEFHMWLKANSSTKIKEIQHFLYRINGEYAHFRIKKEDIRQWVVTKFPKNSSEAIFSFSFVCDKGLDFLDDFEKALGKELSINSI